MYILLKAVFWIVVFIGIWEIIKAAVADDKYKEILRSENTRK